MHAPHPIDDIEKFGIYQVYTGLGTGSGFLIDATHLLTNYPSRHRIAMLPLNA